MIFHLSIDADRPERVAMVIAEFWGGVAVPCPEVIDGAWIAVANDEDNSAIEVYPRGTTLHRAEGDEDAVALPAPAWRGSATHIAIATKLDLDKVMRIARREGWPAKLRRRSATFDLVELWIEDTIMIEVMTAEMQQAYRERMTADHWRARTNAAQIAA